MKAPQELKCRLCPKRIRKGQSMRILRGLWRLGIDAGDHWTQRAAHVACSDEAEAWRKGRAA